MGSFSPDFSYSGQVDDLEIRPDFEGRNPSAFLTFKFDIKTSKIGVTELIRS
jgi:hypothetical protein